MPVHPQAWLSSLNQWNVFLSRVNGAWLVDPWRPDLTCLSLGLLPGGCCAETQTTPQAKSPRGSHSDTHSFIPSLSVSSYGVPTNVRHCSQQTSKQKSWPSTGLYSTYSTFREPWCPALRFHGYWYPAVPVWLGLAISSRHFAPVSLLAVASPVQLFQFIMCRRFSKAFRSTSSGEMPAWATHCSPSHRLPPMIQVLGKGLGY